uniref:Bcl-2 Bcl-2 homology region 1-3 domain-containing protein n=1 Tax=Cynoglossus semilaevis TaxID=244447 RepID=A0A3P8W0Y8_CYNSE
MPSNGQWVSMGKARNSGDQARRSQRWDQALNKETRQLMKQFLGESMGLLKCSREESEALSTMKRVTARLLEKYGNAYNGMIGNLPVDDRGDKVISTGAVARAIFADGTTNWGHIVSLVALGVVVCRHYNEKEEGLDFVESVGDEISTYLMTEEGLADGFVKFFAEPKRISTLGFCVRVATIGLLISLTAI